MSIFNQRMRDIKRISGMTQKEMADRIGVPYSTIAYYFRDREPSYEILIRIAKEFNVSVNWLIGYEDPDKCALYRENEKLREKLEAIFYIVSKNIG